MIPIYFMAPDLAIDEKCGIINNFQCIRTIAGTARAVHRSEQKVCEIVHLWQQTGDVQRRHGNGRPSLIRGNLIQRVAQIIRQNRTASSNSLVDVLRQAGGPLVSPRNMRRTRRQLGFHPVHEQTRPTLTAVHMANRLAYARAHRTDNWHYIIPSDETVFTIKNKGRVCWI